MSAAEETHFCLDVPYASHNLIGEVWGLNPLRSTLQYTRTWWLESRYRKTIAVTLDKPIVSITFDDVPVSAFEHGAAILREQNVKATFYVSLGMKPDRGEPYLSPPQILALHNDGHEIACHTYSHYRLSLGSLEGLVADAKTNREQLARLLNNSGPQNFSFPFGELSLGAKRNLQSSYRSLRTSRPGVNHSLIDLNCLRAHSLGAHNSTRDDVIVLLDKVQEKDGWLIFYSHGVLSNPGFHDTRPEILELILAECSDRCIEVLPVSSAIDLIGKSKAEASKLEVLPVEKNSAR